MGRGYRFFVQAGQAEDGAPWQNYLVKAGYWIKSFGRSHLYITGHYYHNFDKRAMNLGGSSSTIPTSNGEITHIRTIAMRKHSELMCGVMLQRGFNLKNEWIKWNTGLSVGTLYAKGQDRRYTHFFDSTQTTQTGSIISTRPLQGRKGLSVKRWQLRINLGICIELTKRFDVSLGSYIGLRNLVKAEDYEPASAFEPLNYSSLGLRYKFL